jgi:dienelactone hydrolase
LLAFAGGGLGALLGMFAFHHKTRKTRFRVLVPIALVLSVVVGGGALYYSDYYHADATALDAASGTQDIEVYGLEADKLAFVPQDPVAGLVFYPGAKVQAEAYAPLMLRCAQKGVLCVLVRPPLNFALLDMGAARGVAEQFPEVGFWVLAGHSLGGVAAAQYLGGHEDEADALVLLASYSSVDLTSFGGKVLSITGTNDQVLNREAYQDARANLPDGATELAVEGGNHAYFGNYGEQRGDGVATISRDEQQERTVEAIVALIKGE